MTVNRIMTRNPFTVEVGTSVLDARELMRREKVRRLPVIDRHKKLVGIVSEKDLISVTPSRATTLDVYEMTSLLTKLTVDKVMTAKVVTVTPDTLIEDAARLMVDSNIGGLPVLEGERIVGIITESDIFKLFIEHFGTRQKGLRVTALVAEKRGSIAAMTTDISATGANIISLGTFPGDDPSSAIFTLKVSDVPQDKLIEVLKPHVIRILDVRQA
jgi:acetoin utilization protein AcuB